MSTLARTVVPAFQVPDEHVGEVVAIPQHLVGGVRNERHVPPVCANGGGAAVTVGSPRSVSTLARLVIGWRADATPDAASEIARTATRATMCKDSHSVTQRPFRSRDPAGSEYQRPLDERGRDVADAYAQRTAEHALTFVADSPAIMDRVGGGPLRRAAALASLSSCAVHDPGGYSGAREEGEAR